jgi:hypothetical protein
MFGQSRPILFDRYGSRRSRWRMPRWLVLLVFGAGIGAGGVVIVQERYLPPRLSADATEKLRSEVENSNAVRLRQATELSETSKRLEGALADKKKLTDDLAANRALVERQRDDLNSAIGALPPDPRAGVIEVRAGRFVVKGGALVYDVVLTRERASGSPLAASIQFVVAGDSARGTPSTFTSQQMPMSIGAQQVVRGSLALPDGMKARQTTIQVLDRSGGKLLGMRVLVVKP